MRRVPCSNGSTINLRKVSPRCASIACPVVNARPGRSLQGSDGLGSMTACRPVTVWLANEVPACRILAEVYGLGDGPVRG